MKTSKNVQELIFEANKLLENAYCEYSNFPVACIIQLTDGTLIKGVNVENASYGATICAERNALANVFAQGYRAIDIEKIVFTSTMNKPTPPCGLCRQVMVEFLEERVEIILANDQQEMQVVNITELVPYKFDSKELDRLK